MNETKMRSKRSPPPRILESPDEDLQPYEKQQDSDYPIFISWASELYRSLKSRTPKSYLIEDGKVFQNPEHVTWRENLKTLKSNLENRIKKNKSVESNMNISPDSYPDIYNLYDNVLKLEHKSHE